MLPLKPEPSEWYITCLMVQSEEMPLTHQGAPGGMHAEVLPHLALVWGRASGREAALPGTSRALRMKAT